MNLAGPHKCHDHKLFQLCTFQSLSWVVHECQKVAWFVRLRRDNKVQDRASESPQAVHVGAPLAMCMYLYTWLTA